MVDLRDDIERLRREDTHVDTGAASEPGAGSLTTRQSTSGEVLNDSRAAHRAPQESKPSDLIIVVLGTAPYITSVCAVA